MSSLSSVVVAVPLLVAVLVGAIGRGRASSSLARSGAEQVARRVAVGASGLIALLALVLLVGVAIDGSIGITVDDSDGRAVFGLFAGRLEASLVLLTASVGAVVQAFAARSLVGDPRAVRFHAVALALVGATNLTALAASGATLAAGWVATSVVVGSLIGH
ncbi:MAG: hypothetical protein AAGG08_13400 [Actinomycetota bacterium]